MTFESAHSLAMNGQKFFLNRIQSIGVYIEGLLRWRRQENHEKKFFLIIT